MFNALSFATISDCVRHISFVKHDIDTTLFRNWQEHLTHLAKSHPQMNCQVDNQGVLRLKFPLSDRALFFYLYESTDFEQDGHLTPASTSALLSPSQIPSGFERDDFIMQVGVLTTRARIAPEIISPNLTHHQRLLFLTTLKRYFPHD